MVSYNHKTILVSLQRQDGSVYNAAIDIDIVTLVALMNDVGIYTTASCHGEVWQDAYVSIKLGEGIEYIAGTKLTIHWRLQKDAAIHTKIAVLVNEMNRVGLNTNYACRGLDAYICIYVGEGTTYDYQVLDDILTIRWRRKDAKW